MRKRQIFGKRKTAGFHHQRPKVLERTEIGIKRGRTMYVTVNKDISSGILY